jgi:hypothetical protein
MIQFLCFGRLLGETRCNQQENERRERAFDQLRLLENGLAVLVVRNRCVKRDADKVE